MAVSTPSPLAERELVISRIIDAAQGLAQTKPVAEAANKT